LGVNLRFLVEKSGDQCLIVVKILGGHIWRGAERFEFKVLLKIPGRFMSKRGKKAAM